MNIRLPFHLILALVLGLGSAGARAGAYDDLIAAVYRDDTNAVMGLVARGMDVNSVDPAGNTLLHIAARNGNMELMDALIKAKANTQARNRVGDTALMLAATINGVCSLGARASSFDPSTIRCSAMASCPANAA